LSLSKINLVVIGHKDHGKSTLIGRLLYDSKSIPEQKLQEIEAELAKAGDESFRFAFLLDTLEEERRGGLTIDIMQTPFKSKKHVYTIIDCPGHREFIKKMLTGASQADAGVLVVSASEGVQDQTKQHAFLVKTLGIQQLIVAVNKMDQLNYKESKFDEMREKLQPVLKALGYEGARMVPISAFTGENVFTKSRKMEWYTGPSLIDLLDEEVKPSTRPVDRPLRAAVQDVYEMGNEKVIVSKILTGMLEQGRAIVLDPSGEVAEVERIQTFGRDLVKAESGDSVGLVLNRPVNASRGQVIGYPQDRARAPKSFVAEMIVFAGATVKKDEALTIRLGTADARCRVREVIEKIDPINLTRAAGSPDALAAGDVGKLALIPLDPLCVEKYSDFPELGRFVVEGKSGTVAAGIVLETEVADVE